MEDYIVEEVRQIREEYSAQFNYDLKAMCADLKRMEKESRAPRASFGPRLVEVQSLATTVDSTVSVK